MLELHRISEMLVCEDPAIHEVEVQEIEEGEVWDFVVQHLQNQSLCFAKLLLSIITIEDSFYSFHRRDGSLRVDYFGGQDYTRSRVEDCVFGVVQLPLDHLIGCDLVDVQRLGVGFSV